jgi:hypothetical protein
MYFLRKIRSSFFLIPLLLSVHNFANAVEILSKEDTKKTFNTSFEDWKTAAGILQFQNAARILVASQYEITVIVDQGHSLLKVTPSYQAGDLSKPQKISVSVEQRQDFSAVTRSMSDVEIKKMIADWYQKMLPEFTLMTNLDLTSGSAQYDFTIFEVGRLPIIDIVGRESKGCWQQCIKR